MSSSASSILFSRFKVSTIFAWVALGGLLIVAGIGVYQLRAEQLQDRREKLQSLIEVAVNIMKSENEQATAGAITVEQAQTNAKNIIRALRYESKEYFFIVDKQSVFIVHGVNPKLEGQNFYDKTDSDGVPYIRRMVEVAAKGGGFVAYRFPKPGSDDIAAKLSYAAPFEPWGWTVGSGVYMDDLNADFIQASLVSGGIVLAVVICIGILSRMLGANIRRQLGGEPAETAAIVHQVASGNLTVNVGNASPESLLGGLGAMIAALRQLVQDIIGSADRLVANAAIINTTSQEVVAATSQQSDATASIAAAIEQLTVSSGHISDSTRASKGDSQHTLDEALEGQKQVARVTEAVQRVASTMTDASSSIHALEQKNAEITAIAGVIKDIADQTNLLALNAAIEAARAGDQGRGFAVVADEVRKLAERTAQATGEIENMVKTIQHDTGRAVEAMQAVLPEVEQSVELSRSAQAALNAIADDSQRNLDRIVQVADATQEQSNSSTSIAQRVSDIAQMVETASASVGRTAETARELEQLAVALKTKTEQFSI